MLVWLALGWPPLERKLAFALIAFIACYGAVEAVDFACSYLVPLDVAGTPPPDPRNARLRFLITAAAQVPAALVVAFVVALAFRNRGRSPNSQRDEIEPR